MRYKQLKKVVEALDLSFIDKFHAKRRRKVGRKGIKASAVVKAFLIQRILAIPSERQLARQLKNSPTLRRICGFRKGPHHSTLSKKRKRLGVATMQLLFYELVKQTRELEISTGEIVGIDSTDLTAYCNPDKKRLSDQYATWGYSATKGWVFGYKAHIIADCNSELPIAVTVLPAHVHDHEGFLPTYKKMLKTFSFHVKKFLGDCAYDATDIYQTLGRTMKAIIAKNGRGHYTSIKPKDKDYRKRVAIERVNSRSKEELGLDNLKLRGLWKATIHVLTVLSSMLFAAVGSFLAGFKTWRSIVNLR